MTGLREGPAIMPEIMGMTSLPLVLFLLEERVQSDKQAVTDRRHDSQGEQRSLLSFSP